MVLTSFDRIYGLKSWVKKHALIMETIKDILTRKVVAKKKDEYEDQKLAVVAK